MSEYTLSGGFVDALKFDSADLESASLFLGSDFDHDEEEDEPYSVRSMPGFSWRAIESGDWIVRFSDGYRIYPDDEFSVLFEPLK